MSAVSILQHRWFELTFIDALTHSYYPFDHLQDYVLVHKWPLYIATDRAILHLCSPCCKRLLSELQNSSRVRGMWVTSLCSVAPLCLPLDPSSIRIWSEDLYLYIRVFSAVIYYYCFDLQSINYCCATFIIYVSETISFMRCVIVSTLWVLWDALIVSTLWVLWDILIVSTLWVLWDALIATHFNIVLELLYKVCHLHPIINIIVRFGTIPSRDMNSHHAA